MCSLLQITLQKSLKSEVWLSGIIKRLRTKPHPQTKRERKRERERERERERDPFAMVYSDFVLFTVSHWKGTKS